MIDRNRMDGILFAIMGDVKLVDQWWNKNNAAFDGARPLDVWETDPERVRDYIFQAANLGGDYH